MAKGGMVWRMARAAALQSELYEEVEANKRLDGEAVTVVALIALMDGIGLMLARSLGAGAFQPIRAAVLVAFGVAAGLFAYYLWAYVTHYVGRGVFHARSDIGQVRRTIAYAQTPRGIGLLAFVPALGPTILAIAWLWALVAGVIAIRQALELTTGRAVATVVVGWVVAFVIFWILAFLVGIPFLMLAQS